MIAHSVVAGALASTSKEEARRPRQRARPHLDDAEQLPLIFAPCVSTDVVDAVNAWPWPLQLVHAAAVDAAVRARRGIPPRRILRASRRPAEAA